MDKPKVFKIKKATTNTFKLKERESASSWGYGVGWNKYRFRFIHHNPLCYACGSNKDSGVRLHLDHVTAHKGDINLFWDVTNMITLCHVCHSQVTAKFDRFSPPKTLEKLEWLAKTRARLGITHKSKVVPLKGEDKIK